MRKIPQSIPDWKKRKELKLLEVTTNIMSCKSAYKD